MLSHVMSLDFCYTKACFVSARTCLSFAFPFSVMLRKNQFVVEQTTFLWNFYAAENVKSIPKECCNYYVIILCEM